MRIHRVWAVGIVLAGILMLQTPPLVVAQDQPPEPPQDQAPAQDPPGRVAQLDYSTGSVSFQPGGEGDWVQAVTNRPLTTGDNLWADKDSRAELHVGSTALRMDSETSVTFLDLDDQNTQIKLSMGSLVVRVRHLDDGDLLEVDTPNLAFNIQRTGEYRFDVNADGTETDATVWQGRGEATGGGASYLVVAGQQARFSGTDQLDHEINQLPGSDEFDTWSSDRDQLEDRSEAGNYVSEEVTGYEDLDGHGTWSNIAGYGPCWTPVGVAADWAPYRFGHWAWIEPWGWTWVDDEPWGFAPFHYGRWAAVEGRWYWVPGRVFVRPIYAPALVAFVGGGGFHLALSVGGPGVAWFPLGPGEVYMPWYRTSRAYVNNVNITNTRVNITQVTNVYNIYNSRTVNATRITYVNQHVTNAVTAVPRDTFVNARPVGKSFVRVDDKQLAAAPITYRPEEQPVRSSVLGAGAAARVRPPETVVNRQVIATRMPTAPRAPFEQSRAAVNVRTEAPVAPQPAARMANVPQPQASPRYEAQRPPAVPEVTPRPEVPRSEMQQEENPRGQQPSIPRPSGAQSMVIPSHPLVRPAPPVQERPEIQKSEEQKFNSWQQQRQRSAPAAAPRAAQAPRSEKPAHPSEPSHSRK